MTIEEIEIVSNIQGRVKFLPGTWDKRFIRDLHSGTGKELTPGQSEWLYRILYKYRRQVPKTYERYKNHPHCCRKPDRPQKPAPDKKIRVPAAVKTPQLKLF